MPIKTLKDEFDPNHGWANGPEDGLFQGNGDVHTSFWNKAHELTWSVGKNDVWDRRYYGDSKKIYTIEEIRKVAFEKDGPDPDPFNYHAYWPTYFPDSAQCTGFAYDFPCPKPVGQVIIRCPDLEHAESYRPELDTSNGIISISARKGTATASVNAFLSREHNVMVFDADYRGLRDGVRFEIYRHRDSMPQGSNVGRLAAPNYWAGIPEYADYDKDPGNGPLDPPEVGVDGQYFWIRQRFPAEKTFPDGFEYVMMATIEGLDYDVETRENVVGIGAKVPLKPMTHLSRALGFEWLKDYITPEEWENQHGAHREKRLSIELMNGAPGWLASARMSSENVRFTAYGSVMTTRDAKDPFEAARRELDLAMEEGRDRLLAAHNAWWHEFSSRSGYRIGDYEPDLYYQGGPDREGAVPRYNATTPIFADETPWHGNYTLNELWLVPYMIGNHADDLQAWMRMLEEMLPMTQANACDVYGCRGACYPIIHYHVKAEHITYANMNWELGIELTGQALQVFWQYYLYTGKLDFLRERAYPMMREGARFYADYVTKEGDGFYHVVPTVSQEHWGITKKFLRNKDSVAALSMVRYHLAACVEAAKLLDLDHDERATWAQIAANIAPYPTYETEEGPIFVDVRGAEPIKYNLPAHLWMVLWSEHIHIDGDPELLKIARRTYRRRMSTYRPYYCSAIERRLGLPKSKDSELDGDVWGNPVEDLLMSHTGRMHFFPGVPDGVDAEFQRLVAIGAFYVSSEKKGDVVGPIKISSLAGNVCRFRNPWAETPVVVKLPEESPVVAEMNGDTVSFETSVGGNYLITCP